MYTLPKLTLSYNALEPHFDAKTMEIHHTKHHQTYVDKLNAALTSINYDAPERVEDLISNLKDVPESIRNAVRNNGGGHANHCFYWSLLSPQGGGQPSGKLLEALNTTFGSFDAFKKAFQEKAANHFASGWAWLILTPQKKLAITSTPGHDSPLMRDIVHADSLGKPLIVVDVWEHAYYLKFQNRRSDFLSAFWNVVSWPFVEALFDLNH
ncbi:MAG: superoxide dismutase [Verrucomicrobia bacterium GWF2_51_19]|nr:MAG: superoxide dismutase [Verrucomicrobia bacterium GWF2_51_19]HCJ12414.1 superoxide dismutase [Mn] [Opitutae bacterium]